jgi:hypothetical protein
LPKERLMFLDDGRSIDFSEFQPDQLQTAADELIKAAETQGVVLSQFAGANAVGGAIEAEAKRQPARAELTVADIKTSLSEQLGFAYTGYDTYINGVNQQRNASDRATELGATEVEALFHKKVSAWEAAGALDYVKEQMEADPDLKFTLVAQPNIEVSGKELKQLTQDFAEEQPCKAYFDDNLYGRYNSVELSGVIEGEGPVRFLLIPSKFNVLVDSAKKQNAALEELQKDQPYLIVPALAVAPNFWHTLRASGDLPRSKNSADFAGAAEKTGIRHFNLEARQSDKWLAVPESWVVTDGQPRLEASYADGGARARVAVE